MLWVNSGWVKTYDPINIKLITFESPETQTIYPSVTATIHSNLIYTNSTKNGSLPVKITQKIPNCKPNRNVEKNILKWKYSTGINVYAT